ncbi:MAG: hypothetical protein M1457_10065, partial [bacterium]|nr:hypothetical protein [bacterium]
VLLRVEYLEQGRGRVAAPLGEVGLYIGGLGFVSGGARDTAAPGAVPPQLTQWYFDDSPVILDDRRYLGKLTAAGGPLAFVEVPGLARVEWALAPFPSAVNGGRLAAGRLTLTRGGDAPDAGMTIDIYQVRNGTAGTVTGAAGGRGHSGPETLTGGPYPVWVRWMPPSLSVEAAARLVDETNRRLSDGSAGAIPADAATLQAIENEIRAGRLPVLQGGVAPLPGVN